MPASWSRGWWAALWAMLLLLVIPVLAVPVPPLIDYPNHLARACFLAFGQHDPVMRAIFAPRWSIIPNLGIDLLLPPLMHLLPPLIAGRVIVALALIVPVTGSVALGTACFRRRSFWQLGAGFVAYNTMFLIGTLSFQLAAGLALWGAAGWVALSGRRPWLTMAGGGILAVAAFACHLFGCIFFILLITAHELDPMPRGLPAGAGSPRRAPHRMLAVLAVAAIPAGLYVASPFAGAHGAVAWPSPWKKAAHLLMPVEAYSGTEALIIAAALLLPLAAWAARGTLALAPMARVVIPGLLLAYLALPTGAKGGYWIDTRLPVLFGFTLFAVTRPFRMQRGLAAGLAVLFAAQIGFITLVWLRQQPDIAAVRAVLTQVPPGSRVLVVDGNAGQHQAGLGRTPAHGAGATYGHYGAFAFIDRRAFWSDAFSIPGQQPVVVQPAYAIGDFGQKPPGSVARLASTADRPIKADPTQFMDGWPTRYDFVLLLQAQRMAGPVLPARLTLLNAHGTAALYRINNSYRINKRFPE